MSNELSVNKPGFLSQKTKEIRGLELVKEYQRITFLKVVQGKSKPPFRPPFEEGDIIATPDMKLFLSAGDVAHVVPIFCYPEFTIHNPYGFKPFIREKTLDKDSALAKKCLNRDLREFPCPEVPGKMCKYAMHLNFLLIPIDHHEEIGIKPLVASFSVGEWKYGMNFKSLIEARQTDMFGCQFALSTSDHVSGENVWKGMDLYNPEAVSPWVTDEEKYKAYELAYDEASLSYSNLELEVDYEAQNEDYTSNEF